MLLGAPPLLLCPLPRVRQMAGHWKRWNQWSDGSLNDPILGCTNLWAELTPDVTNNAKATGALADVAG